MSVDVRVWMVSGVSLSTLEGNVWTVKVMSCEAFRSDQKLNQNCLT